MNSRPFLPITSTLETHLDRDIGIIISHDKDRYEPTSIMECHKGFDHCAHVISHQM